MAGNEVQDAALRDRLITAAEWITESIDAARSLAVELVPPLLHDQGLPAALEWLARQFKQKHDLGVHLEVDQNSSPRDETVRDLLFQAVRELLLNVVKHAQTRSAEVDVKRQANEVSITVKDGGAGFDPLAHAVGSKSVGLFHLRERIEALAGTFKIKSSPGQGTTVTVPVHVE